MLSKYDVAAGIETTVDMGHGGVGVAVDETTGCVYVTGGAYAGDNLCIWDCSTTPFTEIQDTGRIGNPAGIAIANVSYNPLNLTKDDCLAEDECVYGGANITYDICYNNTANLFDVHSVMLTDDLPSETSFVCATGGGTYDAGTHKVTSQIGDLPACDIGACVQLLVQVAPGTPGETILTDYATIVSDETPPTTVEEETEVCVNHPPDCSEAYADPDCLWPPNHKMVPVSILGVTDPDGDPVTITITAITSDEATATEGGAGGAEHAPDAQDVGTDTAQLRAERSGKANGRVYQVSFAAEDGRGGVCEGTVMVKVPHDQRPSRRSPAPCEATGDGQNYDATQVN
jgi:hypothetical protein